MARDYFDESKNKKKTTKKAATTKSQSSSVSKPKTTKTTASVNKTASKSTFMGGGASTQSVKKASTNNKPKTVKTQPTQQERINQKMYGSTTAPTRKTKSSTTNTQRTKNRDANLNLKQTVAQTSRTRTAANESQRRTAQQQKMTAGVDAAKARAQSREIGRAIKSSVKDSLSADNRAFAQRQKSGTLTEEDNRRIAKANERRAQVARNTKAVAKKAVQDTVTGYGKTLADVTEMTASSKNGAAAKAMKMGYDLNDRSSLAKVEAERKLTTQKARETRLDLQRKQDERQAEWDKRIKNAKGLEKAWYGAVESGTGMLADTAVGAVTGTGQFGALASMGLRTYGTTRGQAEKEGATAKEDRLYSLAQAGKEVATELMFQGAGLAKSAYGKTGLSLADKSANILTKGLTGVKADVVGAGVRALGGTAEENVEELAGWIADPVIKELTYGKNVRNRMKENLRANIPQIGSDADAANVAAYFSTPKFTDDLTKEYVKSGMSQNKAAELAAEMRDYYVAYYSGDKGRLDALETDLAAKLSGQDKLSLKSWSMDELKDTFASTTLLTLATGIPGAINTSVKGNQIFDSDEVKAVFGNDAVRKVADAVKNVSDREMSLKADVMKQRLDSGKDLTGTQKFDLYQGYIEKVNETAKKARASHGVVENARQEQDLVPTMGVDRAGNVVYAKETQREYNEKFESTAATAEALRKYMESDNSISDDEIRRTDAAIKAVSDLHVGGLTIGDAHEFAYGNNLARETLKAEEGIDLDKYIVRDANGNVDLAATNEATENALFQINADNAIRAAQAETEVYIDDTRGNIDKDLLTRFGNNGQAVWKEVNKDLDPRDLKNYLTTANAASYFYSAGRNTDMSVDNAIDRYADTFKTVDNTVLKRAFAAGARDRIIANTPGYGQTVESGSNIQLKKTEPIITGQLIMDDDVVIPDSDQSAYLALAMSTNSNIHIVSNLNAMGKDGKPIINKATGLPVQLNGMSHGNDIYLNVNEASEKNLGYVFMHEMTHQIKQYAPNEYLALENLVRDKWFNKDATGMQAAIKQRIDLYSEKGGQKLTEEEAVEEIIADAMAEAMDDPDFAAEVCEQDINLGQQILESIRTALRSIRQIFANSDVKNDRFHNSLLSYLGILDEAEKMWLNALHTARQNKADGLIADWQDKANKQNSPRLSVTDSDADYMKAVESGDMRKAQSMVEDAAIASMPNIAKNPKYKTGRVPLKLYHGTPSFGFTEFKDSNYEVPFIYTSTDNTVSAHYAGDHNYASPRQIGKPYREGSSTEDIIENAKTVWDTDLKKMSSEEKEARYNEVKEEASKIADKIDELYPDNWQADEATDNAIAWVEDLFFTIRDGDYSYNFKENDGEREVANEILDDSIKRFKENIGKVKEYRDEHYKDLEEKPKALLNYLCGYDVGDAAIDIEYGMQRVATEDDRLVNVGGSVSIPSDLKQALDQSKNIGAYTLYGDLGNNPLEFDADGAQFWAVKVPQIGDDYMSTDSICKWAYENGYTSVIMHNIYDYGDKADNYVFFNSSQLKSADPVTYDDNGDVIPLSERFNQETPDIRYSITPEMDADYMDAVNSGNMDEAQRLVDEAARAAGMRVAHRYHGTMNANFTVFNKAYAKVGGNSGAGFYFSTEEDDSANHYADVEGADNYFKWSELAEHIHNAVSEGEWEGYPDLGITADDIETYEDAEAAAKAYLNREPGTYDVYLNYKNPYVRNYGKSTDLFEYIMDDFDESIIDRNDYDSEDDYEDDLLQYRDEYFFDKINNAVYEAYDQIENFYDYADLPPAYRVVEEIAGHYDYNLNWETIENEIYNMHEVTLARDDWDGSGDGTRELTRAIIEALGFDAVEDKEVSSKFGQLSREMMTDTEHIIVFKPEQIKLSDPVTYREDGSVIPLSERFDPSNPDIRYSMPTTDSDGNILTDGQMEYFKNSQARDEQGRLVPVYHTTNKGGFTIFDPMRSDDHRSLFFAEDWDTSQTYGSYANSRFYYFDIDNIDDVKKYLDAYSPDRYFVTQEQFDQAGGWEADMLDFENVTNGEQSDFAKYLDNPDGYIAIIGVPDYSPDNTSYADTWVMAESPDELVRELHNHFGWQRENYRMGTQHGYYACYLNLEDPYIIDAHGDNWNEIHLDDYDDDVTFNTREIAEMAMDMDFDGVIIRNLVDQGGMSPYDGMFDYSDIYIAFSSNQVKDINNENPTENPDIRYSIVDDDEAMSHMAHDYAYDTSYEALAYYEELIAADASTETTYEKAKNYIAKDVDEFYAGLTRYADGMKFDDPVLEEGRTRMAKSKQDYFNSNVAKWNDAWLTDGEVLDVKSIKKPVRDLVKAVMSESNTNKKYKTELVNKAIIDIRLAYYYAKKGRTDVADALLWHSAHRMIDGVEFYADDTSYEEYKGLRDYMKNTRIQLGEEYWNDVDFGAFRKENFGRINLVKGETNVDKIYAELEDMFPGLFDSETYDNAPDQLMHMASVLDSVQPYAEAYSSEYCAEWATDIASDLLNIMQNGKELQSIADRYTNKYEAKIKAMKARHAEAMLKVRRQRDEGINAQKAKFKEYKEQQREKKAHSKAFESIQKTHKKLTERLLTNTADKNIPEQYKRDLARLLAAFDLQTIGSKKYEMRTGRQGQKTIKMAALKTALSNIENKSNEFHVSDAITDIIDELLGKNAGSGYSRSIEGLTIDELSASELDRIDKLLKALLHEFNTYRDVKVGAKRQQTEDIGKAQVDSALEHAKMFGAGKDYQNIPGGIDRIINLDEVTPAYMFKHIDPEKSGLGLMFKELRRSFDKYVKNQEQLNDWMNEIVGKYHKRSKLPWKKYGAGELENWRSENYSQTFKLESGDVVTLTPAQMMSLYCLSKRTQAYNHMTGAGIVVAPISFNAKILSDLKKKANTALPKKLSDADIKQIVSQLTPDQIKVADDLQHLMADKMAAWGNEASMNVLGIELFGEPDYFPIKSDKAALEKDLNENEFVEAIRNFGFTKAVQPGARNAIMVNDIFDVVTEHCNNMNLYNAYSESINDFMKVYNYRDFRDDGSEYTVQQAIAHAYGSKATTFIMTFMRDLNGNVSGRASGIENLYNSLLGNAKKAAVFANLRVAAQQPTAITRAFAVIDPKYLKGIKIEQGAMDELFEHCPIALWKSWGYYDINMGKSIEDIMMNNGRWLEDAATELYGALDNVTWTAIWQMVKAEMKDTHPDVKVGTDEYWELCNERMTEVVDLTQVVDSPFHRSHAMRDKGIFVKAATSFMAEPTLTFNMLRDGVIRSREAWKKGDKAEAAKIAARIGAVALLQAATVAGAASLVDALRKKRPDKDDEDERFLHLWWVNALENFRDELKVWNKIYFVKDIASIFDGWDNSNLALQGIQKFALGYRQLTGDPYARSSAAWYENAIDGIGYMTGVPVKTVRTGLKNAMEMLGVSVSALDSVGEKLDSVSLKKDEGETGMIGKLLGLVLSDDGDTLLDKYAEKKGYRKINGSADNVASEKTSDSKKTETEEPEEREQLDYDTMLNKALKAAEGYEGEEYNQRIYSSVAKGMKGYIADGDYVSIGMMRTVIEEAGGDTEYFDKRVMEETKTAYKKSLKYDMSYEERWDQKAMYRYMMQHGMSQEELSSEILYKSNLAKDMKVAYRIGDENLIYEAMLPLVDAGITEADLEKLYENRNKMSIEKYKENGRYKDKLKSMGTFIWPTDGVITSHFGYRNAPTAGASSNHPAIDIGAPQGTAVVAADGGVVISAGANGGYGNSVGIKHDNGMITWYNHLYDWNVNVGDTVAQGQQIAQVGSTGISTGPHLDFKIMDVNGNPVDPEKYLQ